MHRDPPPARRRRGFARIAAAACAFAAAVAPQKSARAQESDAAAPVEYLETDRRSFRSPQSWAIELRGGPYRPGVDSEFTNLPADERPHATYFGNGRRMMFGLEGDYQFFRDAGTLAVGLGVSYLREKSTAFIEPGPGNPATERASDQTEFTLVPVALSLVYRFDVIARRYLIPLVPYAKGGLDWVYWSVTDGNGRTSDPEGNLLGRGATLGWHAAAGLSLMLDILDPGAAQALDAEIGVNHTHIFVELGHYDISGLGQSKKMNLSDTTWLAGVLFEF